MMIFLKNKHTLKINDFIFRCCVGKKGFSSNKREGDKKTPKGKYPIGNLYYREDRIKKPRTNLKCIKITDKMGWCDDIKSKDYNRLINTNKKVKHEKLKRKDHKYDLLIPIKYNFIKPKKNMGSCIFIHLTKEYKPTAGCVAISKKDFLVMLKLINKKTEIKIT